VWPSIGATTSITCSRGSTTPAPFARQGKAVVVCLDEAQAVPLESPRASPAFEPRTEKRKLLRLVLFGQPELDVKLADASVRQIKQRIAFHTSSADCAGGGGALLAHRLRVAGHRGSRIFDPSSARLVAGAPAESRGWSTSSRTSR